MAWDADIVRCAAPWPGTAARLLEGLAALGPGIWSLEQICRASTSGTSLVTRRRFWLALPHPAFARERIC
jgi:hypothetical protein